MFNNSIDNLFLILYKISVRACGIMAITSALQADDVGSILDEEYDISVRTGYHCAPWIHDVIKSKPSNGTVRVGVSQFTSKNDVDLLIEALSTL